MRTWSVHIPLLVRELGTPGLVRDEGEYAMSLRYDVRAPTADDATRIIFDRLSEVLRDKPTA